MFFLYRIIINLIILFLPIIVLIRLLKKKEDPIRFKEKLSFFAQKKTKGKLVWFHGASVGEVLSVIPLIKKLEENNDITKILVTSNTLSSSKVFKNLNLKKTIHQFYPIDNSYFVNKFLRHWSPSIAIFIDSEIWPNMLIEIKKKSIPLILLNARINKRSYKRWSGISSISKKLFNKFDLCLASSNESKKHLKLLGAKNIKYIGNLKFTELETNKDTISKKLKKKFLSKKIWCASSTHENEEKIVAQVHIKLKRQNQNILTIIIPRHINRVIGIIKMLQKLNLKVHMHGSQNKIDNNTDIYLVDIYGKTKMFYSICGTVFLGGSLIKHGGQNPLEAARYGCQILHGPNIWNFDEIYQLLNRSKVSHKVKNINQISEKISLSFSNKKNTKHIKNKLNLLSNKILRLTLKEINYFIKKK
jgi:3-deoxy-D-manno-octulosonic-acid transferase